MGLDHGLVKRTAFWRFDGGVVRAIDSTCPSIRPERVRAIEETVITWRKVNHIHGWFVKNVQDGEDNCEDHDVSVEQLQELVRRLKLTLEDRSKAEELLPTAEGFFFGGTEYDEWYWRDTEEALKVLEEELGTQTIVEGGERGDVSYRYWSSW